MRRKTNQACIRVCLQRYADLVICPRARHVEQYGTLAQLNAQRLVAAQDVIRACPELALVIGQMAASAQRGLPFPFTPPDAWRIAVDMQHTMARLDASPTNGGTHESIC